MVHVLIALGVSLAFLAAIAGVLLAVMVFSREKELKRRLALRSAPYIAFLMVLMFCLLFPAQKHRSVSPALADTRMKRLEDFYYGFGREYQGLVLVAAILVLSWWLDRSRTNPAKHGKP
jgi:hypothetical protein